MISLKTYNRDIEQLIDNAQYDEAIAHCKNILLTYPKCIDSYRNLGKALLELKNYPEALDVFSRVLSALPDDFISHVGLAIIFEDQNNLDLAIWHMEQAFDIQPSNLAIQDELKRLFGRRDGEQPSKIRLTRGALVRMYARGELYQQAISEIQSILADDPRRVDLEVILARMYYLSGLIDDSIIICNRIIEKIPYCFEANQILQQIQIDKKNVENAAIYKILLTSLDPYYEFSTFPFSDQDIPENKVMLEKLQYSSTNLSDIQIPVWVEDNNKNNFELKTESIDWLSNINKKDRQITGPDTSPFSVENQSGNNQGLSSNLVNPDSINNSFLNSNNNVEPDKIDDNSKSQSIFFEKKDKKEANVTKNDLVSLFSQLKEGKMANEEIIGNGNEEKQFPPSDWMSQFSNPGGPDSTNASDQDFPDWLKNFQTEEPDVKPNSDEMPDWLKDLQSEVEKNEPALDNSPANPVSSNIVIDETSFNDIFDQKSTANKPLFSDTDQQSSEDQDDWEKIDLVNTTQSESILPTPDMPDSDNTPSDDRIPDWVKSVLLDENSNQISEKIQDQELDQEDTSQVISSIDSNSTPSTSSSTLEEQIDTEAGIISQQTNDELLDWLRGLKTEEETQLPEETNSPKDEISDIDLENIFEPLSTNNTIPDSIDQSTIIDEDIVNNELLPQGVQEDSDSINRIIPTEPIEELSLIQDTPVAETENPIYNFEAAGVVQPSDEIKDRIQTSELHIDKNISQNELSFKDQIVDLINQGDFDSLSQTFDRNIDQGNSFEELISIVLSVSDKQLNSFPYWQFLGDLYSKNNHLFDALSAYQLAEDILVSKL